METSFDQTWLMPIRKIENARLVIVCFPYGGGSASKFWAWKNLSIKADIWALKLPGRESRISEPLVTSANEVVDNIIKALPSCIKTPFVFYGHSMGAGLAFQTMLELQRQKKTLPKLFIASGREPPHFKTSNIESQLNDENLVRYIQQLGGVAGKIPRNEEFIRQYIPKIRADYILNHDIPIKRSLPLPVHINIINGKEDILVRTELLHQWAKHTKYPLTSVTLPGGHFFIEEFFDKFIYEIEKQISGLFPAIEGRKCL